jgi:hypothetical protein
MPIFIVTLSDTGQIEVLIFCFFFRYGMQTNKTLTELNLENNDLGPEGGKAIATSLQVTFPFLLLALSL